MIRSLVELLDENEPVLALAIHNGHEMHPALQATCGISEADRLREEDPYTEQFTTPFKNRIVVYTSRFTVDLNRRREQAVYQNPEDCWGLPARTEPLSEELLAELHADYDSWYGLLHYTVERLLQKHPFLLVLDLHSYNHRRQGPDAPPDPQEGNPDIILGRNNMPQSFYPGVEKLRLLLDGKQVLGHTIDCRCDVKFPGGQLSRTLHKEFEGRVLSLSVEFKKIFMDEWTGILNKEFQTALSQLFNQAVQNWRKELII